MTDWADLTWTCHICGRERPDALIGVMQHQTMVRGIVSVTQNVRYCLDTPACAEGAMTKRFIETPK